MSEILTPMAQKQPACLRRCNFPDVWETLVCWYLLCQHLTEQDSVYLWFPDALRSSVEKESISAPIVSHFDSPSSSNNGVLLRLTVMSGWQPGRWMIKVSSWLHLSCFITLILLHCDQTSDLHVLIFNKSFYIYIILAHHRRSLSLWRWPHYGTWLNSSWHKANSGSDCFIGSSSLPTQHEGDRVVVLVRGLVLGVERPRLEGNSCQPMWREGEDTVQPITSAPWETYYRGGLGRELVINLERADIGFDAQETDNIGCLVHVSVCMQCVRETIGFVCM